MSKLLTKKKIIWTGIVLLAVGGIWYKVHGGNSSGNILTDTAKKQDLKQTVLATGQVVSGTDLSLAFKISGIVQQVNVKEGDKAKRGQSLAALEQKDQFASLTSAQGALASAQANYDKVLAGASSEDIAVAQKAVDAAEIALKNAQISLDNTKQQQDTAVKNAYSALLNSTITAVPASGNAGSATVTISGAYSGSEQGVYNISIYVGGNLRFQTSGLENAGGDVRSVPVVLGAKGLFIQFSGTVYSSDTWTITIPNTVAGNYVTNYNAYQAALRTQSSGVDSAQASADSAQTTLASAQAALDLKRAQARPADIDAAKAQILSATGQVQAAQAALENTIIRAPADGTITLVDVKVGEQAAASKEAVVLQDVGNLHVEANISEANIAELQPGQNMDLTFDALGPDRHFKAVVQTVNPASTVISGVVNYKITASLDHIPEIKPGMTANMTVLIAQKDNVVAIPLRAVINKAGKKTVRVIDDAKKKTYHEVEIQTGLEADGGLAEVVSGLNDGQEIVTYIKP